MILFARMISEQAQNVLISIEQEEDILAQNGEVTNWILDSVGARWLYDFVRQHMPSVIVECGTSVGYSAIWLGEAAREYGGHVYSIEKDSVKYAQATMHIQEAGCENVTCLIGDAEDILKSWNGPDIDLLFLDANKKGYLPQFLVAEPYFCATYCGYCR